MRDCFMRKWDSCFPVILWRIRLVEKLCGKCGIRILRISLAVRKANFAVRRYEKVGFKAMEETAQKCIMVRKL